MWIRGSRLPERQVVKTEHGYSTRGAFKDPGSRPVYESRGALRPNKYEGVCVWCQGVVEPEVGWTWKPKKSDRWLVSHLSCREKTAKKDHRVRPNEGQNRRFTNRYPGSCHWCKKWVAPGAGIAWNLGTSWAVSHSLCMQRRQENYSPPRRILVDAEPSKG